MRVPKSSSVVSPCWADTKAERLEPRVLRWCKRAKKAKKGQKKGLPLNFKNEIGRK